MYTKIIILKENNRMFFLSGKNHAKKKKNLALNFNLNRQKIKVFQSSFFKWENAFIDSLFSFICVRPKV